VTRPGLNRFIVLSGCSGGGKSTLLAELARLGHAVVEEPGRRVVRREMARGGDALPWLDMEAFARACIEVALQDRVEAGRHTGWVFFDRGLVDAGSALQAATGESMANLVAENPYNPKAFLTPPWPELFHNDGERRHSLEESVAEYERLQKDFAAAGYEIAVLPRVSIEDRASRILSALGPHDAGVA